MYERNEKPNAEDIRFKDLVTKEINKPTKVERVCRGLNSFITFIDFDFFATLKTISEMKFAEKNISISIYF